VRRSCYTPPTYETILGRSHHPSGGPGFEVGQSLRGVLPVLEPRVDAFQCAGAVGDHPGWIVQCGAQPTQDPQRGFLPAARLISRRKSPGLRRCRLHRGQPPQPATCGADRLRGLRPVRQGGNLEPGQPHTLISVSRFASAFGRCLVRRLSLPGGDGDGSQAARGTAPPEPPGLMKFRTAHVSARHSRTGTRTSPPSLRCPGSAVGLWQLRWLCDG
jgi:hypothetical protein